MSEVIATPGSGRSFARPAGPVMFVFRGEDVADGVPDGNEKGFRESGRVWLVGNVPSADGSSYAERQETEMPQVVWSPAAVVALIPADAPGEGDYRVRIEPDDGQEFLVPLTIYGEQGEGGYEPVPLDLLGSHHRVIASHGGAQPPEDDFAVQGTPVVFVAEPGESFGAVGTAELRSDTDGGYEPMRWQSMEPVWREDMVVAWVPENAPGRKPYTAVLTPQGSDAPYEVPLDCRSPDGGGGYPPFHSEE